MIDLFVIMDIYVGLDLILYLGVRNDIKEEMPKIYTCLGKS